MSRRSRHSARRRELVRGQAASALGLDLVHRGARPIDPSLRRGKDSLVDVLVAQGVVAHPARRVEVDCLEGPMNDQRSARPSRIATSTSSVLASPSATSRNASSSRRPADGSRRSRRSRVASRSARGPRLRAGRPCAGRRRDRSTGRNDFDRRNEIGRIDGVGDEASRTARQSLAEDRRQDRRGRTREHRVGIGPTIELGEYPPLRLDVLGRVLLNMARAFERLVQRAGPSHPGAHGKRRLAAKEIVGVKLGKDAVNKSERVVDRLGRSSQIATSWPARAKLTAQARPTNPRPTRAILPTPFPPVYALQGAEVAGSQPRGHRSARSSIADWPKRAEAL